MPYKNAIERQIRHKWRLENEPGFREKHNAKMLVNWYRRVRSSTQLAEEHRARTRKWRSLNLERARAAARKAAAKQRLTGKPLAHARKAQTARMKRFPVWANQEKILAVYEQAKTLSKLTGEPWHVDHVIPLQGKTVSGLHVHTNLQILPGKINLQKSNKFEVN